MHQNHTLAAPWCLLWWWWCRRGLLSLLVSFLFFLQLDRGYIQGDTDTVGGNGPCRALEQKGLGDATDVHQLQQYTQAGEMARHDGPFFPLSFSPGLLLYT